MKQIIEHLISPSWWVGVVLVGIAINIVSPYIGRFLERRTNNASTWLHRKSLERAERRRKIIESLTGDNHKQIVYWMRMQEVQHRALVLAMAGSVEGFLGVLFIRFYWALPGIIIGAALVLLGLVTLAGALDDWNIYRRINSLLQELYGDEPFY